MSLAALFSAFPRSKALGAGRGREPVNQTAQFRGREGLLEIACLAARKADKAPQTSASRVSTGVGTGLAMHQRGNEDTAGQRRGRQEVKPETDDLMGCLRDRGGHETKAKRAGQS